MQNQNNNILQGKRTIVLQNQPRIITATSIVGPKEGQGPLGSFFGTVIEDDKLNEKTFEKAERTLLHQAIEEGVTEAKKLGKDVSMLIGGDLLNQNISTSFTAREMHLPLIGLYSACSTMSESLALGAILIDGGYGDNIACATVSHFSSAERQYRTPLEQGTQRPPLSQWTVTGAGCAVLSKEGDYPKISKVHFGEVVDYGIIDANNMGAAMAPAAMTTLVKFFEDTNTSASDFDLIVTGDLGVLGSEIMMDLMEDRNFPIRDKYIDCGTEIYEKKPSFFQGGSGAGCSASIFCSYIYQKLVKKEINRMLFLATGALLSTTSSLQGESIPSISHLVEVIS